MLNNYKLETNKQTKIIHGLNKFSSFYKISQFSLRGKAGQQGRECFVGLSILLLISLWSKPSLCVSAGRWLPAVSTWMRQSRGKPAQQSPSLSAPPRQPPIMCKLIFKPKFLVEWTVWSFWIPTLFYLYALFFGSKIFVFFCQIFL